ncbi:MAG: hypothetical protein AB7V50_08135 [Vampirovibrionia bacterium]
MLTSSILENVKRKKDVIKKVSDKRVEKMPSYLSLKEYSDYTKRSLASVYRDAEKGMIKIAIIKGKKHVIVEEDIKIEKDIESLEKDDNSQNDKVENEYKDVEVMNISDSQSFQLEVFNNSIATIEEMANRIEAAKNETINNLLIESEKKEKRIEDLNEILKTVSSDNQELRSQLAIREAEINISEKRLEEMRILSDNNDKRVSQLDKDINNLKNQKAELLAENDNLMRQITNLKDEKKLLEDQLNFEKEKNQRNLNFWDKL